jgi:aminoglycoside phosphotransferase (APT) family kinase protein
MADFTHQIIARDYIFQTFIAGERWDDIAESITLEEQLQLWEQFGYITKTIHSTVGTAFGGPYPLAEFPTWSQTINNRLEHVVYAMTEAQLDVTDIRSVLTIVRNRPTTLDTIRQPHLLHGDLWLFNILIKRSPAGSNIVGILDADRAWWGDPLADWTMFVLEKSASPDTQRFHDCFWQGYGQVDQTPNTEFCKTVYEAMHIGTALAWAVRAHDDDTVERGRYDLSVAATNLSNLLS